MVYNIQSIDSLISNTDAKIKVSCVYASVSICVSGHVVVCSFVCVLQSSDEICSTSRSRYFVKIKLNRFVIEGLFFELWRDLLT